MKTLYAEISAVLDPEFVKDLQANAQDYDGFQSESDDSKWVIARRVNEMWEEHKNMTYPLTTDPAFPTKMDYYAECSRVANIGLKHKRFSDSGETLRRWCEIQESYAAFSQADLLLSELSFDHLVRARKLARDEKVKSPILALAKAMEAGYTADEMQEHFDPKQPVHPYDKVKGWLAGLLDKNNWKWVKKSENVKQILFHAAEIKRLSEEKADA